jgi:hypothetical protein
MGETTASSAYRCAAKGEDVLSEFLGSQQEINYQYGGL